MAFARVAVRGGIVGRAVFPQVRSTYRRDGYILRSNKKLKGCVHVADLILKNGAVSIAIWVVRMRAIVSVPQNLANDVDHLGAFLG